MNGEGAWLACDVCDLRRSPSAVSYTWFAQARGDQVFGKVRGKHWEFQVVPLQS